MWKVSIKILGNSKYGAWRKDLYSNFAKEKVYIRGDFMENNDDKRYTGKGNKVILYNILEIHRLFSFSNRKFYIELAVGFMIHLHNHPYSNCKE